MTSTATITKAPKAAKAPRPHVIDMDALRRQRDELAVQMHLGGEELREQWREVEVKWDRLQGEAKRFGDQTRKPARTLIAAVAELGRDLGESYQRIGAALRRPT